ncbi:MAG: DUF45 domain-containing protein [Opitutales bacterium]|nr:DUF45 domain-containing protein [Opitutales bacterium]
MATREIILELPIKENDNACKETIVVTIKDVANSRSFKLRITDKYTAILTKPRYASIKDSLSFLEANKIWLIEQSLKTTKKQTLAKLIQQHRKVYHLDKEITPEIIVSRTNPFFVSDIENNKLVLAPTEQNFDLDLENLFLKFTNQSLAELAKLNSNITGLNFSKVSIRNQSSLWASRSSSGLLSLNWRIILLEPKYQTYIIRHELAHTKFMDHSVSFWIFLNRICPDAQRLDREVESKSKEIFNIQLTKNI